MRADLFLFTGGHVKSRQKGKALIENQCVLIDGKLVTKPSQEIDEQTEHKIEITDNCIYVSRGGLKLEAILDYAKIDVNEKICLDIGASTGGFTDCLLRRGASKVYAIDSGSNQLDKELKNDIRVVSIENFNARNDLCEVVSEKIDVITIDVSFISQTLIIPSAFKTLGEDGICVSLIKPQFEVGKAGVGKGGIVKDKKFRKLAVMRVVECANSLGYYCKSLIKSPILGGDGNTEYLAVFSKKGENLSNEKIINVINS